MCVCMLYHALQAQWANLGHLGGGEDEGQVETVWKSTVCLLITGCFTSGRKTQGSIADRVIEGDQQTD